MAEEQPHIQPEGAPPEANDFSYPEMNFPQLTREQFETLPLELQEALWGLYQAFTQFVENAPKEMSSR